MATVNEKTRGQTIRSSSLHGVHLTRSALPVVLSALGCGCEEGYANLLCTELPTYNIHRSPGCTAGRSGMSWPLALAAYLITPVRGRTLSRQLSRLRNMKGKLNCWNMVKSQSDFLNAAPQYRYVSLWSWHRCSWGLVSLCSAKKKNRFQVCSTDIVSVLFVKDQSILMPCIERWKKPDLHM